jgi:hypothetical protein
MRTAETLDRAIAGLAGVGYGLMVMPDTFTWAQRVELKIVHKASDNTIGRVLKKRSQTPHQKAMGYLAQGEQRIRSGDGRCAGSLSPPP